jgi:protein TonB
MAATTTAPSPAERRAKRAAAPAPGAAAQSNALPSWRSALVARLERNKRYPSDAGGVRGVAVLAFNVDRSGGVHNARIAKSSGSPALDRETLALATRAQPLPPPPAELSGAQIPISVPLRYNMD